MIVAIVANVGTGQVKLEEFREAASEAAAVTAFVGEYSPPLDSGDYFGYDTGWSEGQKPSAGKRWAYDFDSPGLVELALTIPGGGFSLGRMSPTADGEIAILGWNVKTDAAAALSSASPLTIGEPAYHTHVVIDVSGASGLPFTVRVTGTSFDESTGASTPADTEDLTIAANGYYQTSKSWLDAVEISIVEASKSCTLDVYRNTYWDRGNTNFSLLGCRMEWTPDETAWSLRLMFWHVQSDGSMVAVDDVTFANTDSPPRAGLYKPGKYKRGDYNTAIRGSGQEGVIVSVDQTGIGSFYLEAKLNG